MKNKIIAIVSWAMAIWMCKVFLFSLPYKFTLHPDTRHIFETIGNWMSGFLGSAAGELFARYGAYAVGSFELVTSIILLLPALAWLLSLLGGENHPGVRSQFHMIGGALAAMVMGGAVFFHLFTPLGIVVLHQGIPDGGSLFFAALSIMISGVVMFFINYSLRK